MSAPAPRIGPRGPLAGRRGATAVLAVGLTAGLLSACGGHSHKAASSTPLPSSGSRSASTSTAATSGAATTSPGKKTSGPAKSTSKPPSSGAVSTGTVSGETGGQPTGCGITTPESVAQAYAAKVASATEQTSAIGNPTCKFSLSSTSLGIPGVVTVSNNVTETAAVFAQTKKSAGKAAVSISGVGDNAYYLPAKTTLQFIRHGKVIVIQATIKVPGEAQRSPAQVQAQTVALGKAISATL